MTPAYGLVAVLAAAAGFVAAPARAEPDDAAPCASDQLVVTATGPDAAAGHRAVTLVFTLAPGALPCTLTGYPAVESGTGGPPMHAEPTLRGYLGGLPSGLDTPPIITLTPVQQGQSIVEGMAVDGNGVQCPTYSDLRVSAPGTVEFVTVSTSIDSCRLQVHPVTGV